MAKRRPPTPREGDPIRMEDFQAVADLAGYAAGITADPTSGLAIADGPCGPIVTRTDGARMDIKITGGGTGGKYAWSRAIPAPGGGWTIDAGTSGTTSLDPAYERGGNATVPVPSIVPAEREAGEWRFDWRSCS